MSCAAVCFVVVALLAGCAGVRGTPAPARIDVRALDVGTYPLNRVTYDRPAGTYGGLVEGMRMSGAMATGLQLDPMLTAGRGGHVLADVHDAVRLGGLADATRPVLERDRMLAGYTATAADQPRPKSDATTSPTATVITTALLRFPDADTATRAATELEAADFDVAPALNRRLLLADYGAAHIHWQPGVPTAGAFLAHGDFVLWVFAHRPSADESDLLAWLHKVFDVQIPALDRFRLTPERDLPNLRVDAESMLARMMTRDRDQRAPNVESFAVLSPNAIVMGSADAGFWSRAYGDAGADLLAYLDRDTLIRARDAKSARALMDTLVAKRHDEYVDADPPAHVLDVHCLVPKPDVPSADVQDGKCYLAYGRYLAAVNDKDQAEARRRAAAQYALLANSF
ncbi:hypothetical protein [Nocardia sp. NPDC059239]|uniref:DUF7373 family lipoprotein n=1 Tax=unclassified Nocardia TaxID=2637762 RepID=UPI0036C9BD05